MIRKTRLTKKDIERLEKWLEPLTSEAEDQERLIKYIEQLQKVGDIVKFTAIPNSTYTPHIAVKMRNKRQGVRPGLCDIFIIYKNKGKNKAVFLELKTEVWGVVSNHQKEWIEAINETEGLQAFVVRGYKEAETMITKLIYID